jgi:hypothetical protein
MPSMMKVGVVRVLVPQGGVTVPVRVRLVGLHSGAVLMLVVRVVNVLVLMLQRFVKVLVIVCFGEVNVDADRH